MKSNPYNTDTRLPVDVTAVTPSTAADTAAAVDRCCSVYYATMASVYNVAQTAMVDAQWQLSRRPDIYRHAVKHDIRHALTLYERWNRRMRQTLGQRYQFWLDLSDTVDDELRRHVFTLRMAFDNYMLAHGIADHTLLAYAETALTLVNLAADTFDRLFDAFRQAVHADLRPLFRGGDFKDIRYFWKRACCRILRTPPGSPDINFNESPDARLAFRIIAARIASPAIYNKAGEQALRANPDMWRHLDKESRLRLKQGLPLEAEWKIN